ncbi:PX-domain-containing protein [Phanerochaete sordida]|uniref:PX-domain-containing protein n=1 Tax=Phanerochaete sordida TaxID=48140 RepID=A0A9P3FYX1_9APHY|nr:PX-domain-containing protein [Phanerochaete sordida]
MSKPAAKPPTSSFAAFLNALSWSRARKDPDFDAGLNSSSAWTEALTNPDSAARASLTQYNVNALSDDEADDEADAKSREELDDPVLDAEQGQPARALYAFEGKPEFRELTAVQAGDRLAVLRGEVGDGWSLVKHWDGTGERKPEVGLIPQSYYTFTAEFAQSPGLELPAATQSLSVRREGSGSSITPRGSPTRQLEDSQTPLIPQTTGEWFPSFRRSLLGGKQLNRFSSFVTSGAEEWVLQGAEDKEPPPPARHSRGLSTSSLTDDAGLGEADKHFVEAGPAWRTKVPPFRILVHSPSKRASMLSGAYTMYAVTSLFGADADDDASGPPPSPMRITVHRRFSHFVVLHTALTRRLPGIALPPLPEKQYAGRFNDDFVEARRGDLERYLSRVVRHPVARYAEVLTFFLGCESEMEWKRQYPQYLTYPPAGPTFFAHVFHPAFNVDSDEAVEAADRNVYGRIRQASVDMSQAQRLLSYSLLSLITSQPLAQASTAGIPQEEGDRDPKLKGHMNEEGAWCWREGCAECLKLTKAMQKTSETLQTVADLYDDHARRTQFATHESLKSVAHPSAMYAGVVDTHRSTLVRYHEATADGEENEEVAARCETVLNTTMAEFETYHDQKVEDFQTLTTEYLDGEIELYEQILARLRAARRTFDAPAYDALARGPRQPSMYERELEHPRLAPPPLTQPCPHVFDSAPMRPVSVAIQEGVGMLLGSPTRASVFGKFFS